MSPKRFTIATIALFSASEQVHCALVQLYFVCCVYYRTCYIINIVLLCTITRFNTHLQNVFFLLRFIGIYSIIEIVMFCIIVFVVAVVFVVVVCFLHFIFI